MIDWGHRKQTIDVGCQTRFWKDNPDERPISSNPGFPNLQAWRIEDKVSQLARLTFMMYSRSSVSVSIPTFLDAFSSCD